MVRPVPPGSLVEFLAVRLLLDRFALAYTAREALGYDGPLSGLRDAIRAGRIESPWPPSVEQRAFLVFQLAQVAGLSADLLYRLSRDRVVAILRGDRGLLGRGAAAGLPPGLRAAVLHPGARRDRAARP